MTLYGTSSTARTGFHTQSHLTLNRHTVFTRKRNFCKSDAQDINTREREYLAEQLKLSLLAQEYYSSYKTLSDDVM